MRTKYLDETKRQNVRQRVIFDFQTYGRVRVNDICKQEHISNTPIYDMMKEMGITHRNALNQPTEPSAELRDSFQCTGFKQGCTSHCPRVFQYPCPLEERWF